MPKTVTMDAATLTIHDDGLMHFVYGEGVLVDLDAARAVIAGARDALDTIAPHPTLVDLGRVKGVTRDAREFFSSSQENMEIASRVALIAGNPIARVVGNFFLGLNRPPVPVKLFGDVDSARAWLDL
jgi:hypothetical protein